MLPKAKDQAAFPGLSNLHWTLLGLGVKSRKTESFPLFPATKRELRQQIAVGHTKPGFLSSHRAGFVKGVVGLLPASDTPVMKCGSSCLSLSPTTNGWKRDRE